MMYTRGDYDVIVMLEAPDMDTLLSLKLAMMKTGAIAELNIHEEIDLGANCKKWSDIRGRAMNWD